MIDKTLLVMGAAWCFVLIVAMVGALIVGTRTALDAHRALKDLERK